MNTHVNFETAKSLKENGFDINQKYQNYFIKETYYNEDEELIECETQSGSLSLFEGKYSAPTIAEVVMWLYDRQIDISHIVNWSFEIRTYRAGIVYVKNNKIESVFLRPKNEKFKFIEFNSPTEAYEAAIEYALNKLI